MLIGPTIPNHILWIYRELQYVRSKRQLVSSKVACTQVHLNNIFTQRNGELIIKVMPEP